MSEAQIKKQILKVLKEQGGFWRKIHGGPFQESGLPDIIGCYQGKFIGLEIKKPGEEATPLQLHVLDEIKKNKGLAAIVESVQDVLILLSPVWMLNDPERFNEHL